MTGLGAPTGTPAYAVWRGPAAALTGPTLTGAMGGSAVAGAGVGTVAPGGSISVWGCDPVWVTAAMLMSTSGASRLPASGRLVGRGDRGRTARRRAPRSPG